MSAAWEESDEVALTGYFGGAAPRPAAGGV